MSAPSADVIRQRAADAFFRKVAGSIWQTTGGFLTTQQVRDVYDYILAGDHEAIFTIFHGASGMSDRRIDRALQILKNAKLIEFDRSISKWRVC